VRTQNCITGRAEARGSGARSQKISFLLLGKILQKKPARNLIFSMGYKASKRGNSNSFGLSLSYSDLLLVSILSLTPFTIFLP